MVELIAVVAVAAGFVMIGKMLTGGGASVPASPGTNPVVTAGKLAARTGMAIFKATRRR